MLVRPPFVFNIYTCTVTQYPEYTYKLTPPKKLKLFIWLRDGAAQTSSVALILRVASATELMLLRRSWCCAQRCCDGAATVRRSRCCDGAAQTSSAAHILRVASRRDTLNEEPASFPPVLI